MAENWKTVTAREVTAGDTIRVRGEHVLVVTRIDEPFLGRPGMIAFIEDSPTQWLSAPSAADGEVELLVADAG
jgi:hypothetical protein